MKPILILSICILAGCSLTPAQLKALDGAVCTKTAGAGFSNTTSAVGGASKSGSVHVSGTDCSITTVGTKP